jgi:integrase
VDAIRPYLPKAARPNLVAERYADWLKVKQAQVEAGERSPRTVQEYERFARPGGEISWWAGKLVGDIDSATLEDWSTWLAERGLGAKTRCHVLGAFRTFCTWLRRRKDIISIPEFPERPRMREHEPRIITPEQQDAVLAQMPDDERGIYLVLAHMGLRPGEARALDVGDLREGRLVVSKAMKGLGPDARILGTKTGDRRRLPLPPAVSRWFAEHPPPAEGPLFLNLKTGTRWSHWALRDRWVEAAKKAGVKAGLYEGRKHSFATAALDRTGNERAVQECLGHADPRSTRLYAKLVEDRLAEVADTRPTRH